jgi:hypothetical protein
VPGGVRGTEARGEENKRLKSIGISQKDRPKEPPRDPNYPTKQDIALTLLNWFGADFTDIKVQCILPDALYGDKKKFMDQKWDRSECGRFCKFKNLIIEYKVYRLLGQI